MSTIGLVSYFKLIRGQPKFGMRSCHKDFYRRDERLAPVDIPRNQCAAQGADRCISFVESAAISYLSCAIYPTPCRRTSLLSLNCSCALIVPKIHGLLGKVVQQGYICLQSSSVSKFSRLMLIASNWQVEITSKVFVLIEQDSFEVIEVIQDWR